MATRCTSCSPSTPSGLARQSRGTSTTTRTATRPPLVDAVGILRSRSRAASSSKRRLYALAPRLCRVRDAAPQTLRHGERFDVVHAHWVVPNGVIAAGVSGRRGISPGRHAARLGHLARRAEAVARQSRATCTFARARVGHRAEPTICSNEQRRLGATGRRRAHPVRRGPRVFRPDPEVRGACGEPHASTRRRARARHRPLRPLEGLRRPHRERRNRARERCRELKLVLVGDGDPRGELEAQAAIARRSQMRVVRGHGGA